MCPDVSACSLTNEVFKDKENAIYRSVGVWMDDPMKVILPVVVASQSVTGNMIRSLRPRRAMLLAFSFPRVSLATVRCLYRLTTDAHVQEK